MTRFLYLITLIFGLLFCGCASPLQSGQKSLFLNHKEVLHFSGFIPGANSTLQYKLDIFSNYRYFLKIDSIKNEKTIKIDDEKGHWHIDMQHRLVLNSQTKKTRYLYIIDENNIEIMNLKGERIDTKLNYKLETSLQ